MNVILKELERRQKQLDEYEAKVERLNAMKTEVACLEKEVSETNTFELKDEIQELTEFAKKLGFIQEPVVEEVVSESVEETVEEQTEEVAENSFQAPITSL